MPPSGLTFVTRSLVAVNRPPSPVAAAVSAPKIEMPLGPSGKTSSRLASQAKNHSTVGRITANTAMAAATARMNFTVLRTQAGRDFPSRP